MKLYDKVKVIKDREEYKKYEVYSGMIGRINEADIRFNYFEVIFIDPKFYDKSFVWTDENMKDAKSDILCEIRIEDLELVEDGKCPDEWILDGIPNHSPKWWCKVENGYIINLLGEKKNKIPYDYNS